MIFIILTACWITSDELTSWSSQDPTDSGSPTTTSSNTTTSTDPSTETTASVFPHSCTINVTSTCISFLDINSDGIVQVANSEEDYASASDICTEFFNGNFSTNLCSEQILIAKCQSTLQYAELEVPLQVELYYYDDEAMELDFEAITELCVSTSVDGNCLCEQPDQ